MDDLEQELRAALRRKEPSPDFTARVLARVQANSEPERRVLNFSAVVRMDRRWLAPVVMAAAACLLIAASALIYRDLHGEKSHRELAASSVEHSGSAGVQGAKIGTGDSATNPRPQDGSDKVEGDNNQRMATPAQARGQIPNNEINPAPHVARSTSQRARIARAASVTKADRVEGERAKQQLELALYIASSKLNQAERVVSHQDDQPAPSDREEHRMDR